MTRIVLFLLVLLPASLAAQTLPRVAVVVDVSEVVASGRIVSWTARVPETAAPAAEAQRRLTGLVLGALQTGTFPEGWRSNPDFLNRTPAFLETMKARLQTRGAMSAVVVKLEPAAPGAFQLRVVAGVPAEGFPTGVVLHVKTWLVTAPEVGPAPPVVAEILDNPEDPFSLSALLKNSEILFEPEASRPEGLPADVSAARRQLDVASAQLLEQLCRRLQKGRAGRAREIVADNEMTAVMSQARAALLGGAPGMAADFGRVRGEKYHATWNGIDPVFRVATEIPLLLVPPSIGASPMKLEDFRTRFPAGPIRESVDQAVLHDSAIIREIGGAFLARPRFVTADEISRLVGTVADDRRLVKSIAQVNAVPDPASGTLHFTALYCPSTSDLSVTGAGDTTRALTGNLAYTKSWARGVALSLAGTAGLHNQSASGDYTGRQRTIGRAGTLTNSLAGVFSRDDDVRLGNRSGPLVVRRDATLGAKAAPAWNWTHASAAPAGSEVEWTEQGFYEASVAADYRWLSGSGPTAFLPPGTTRRQGPVIRTRHAFEYVRGPALKTRAESDPPEVIRQARRTLRPGTMRLGLAVEASEFVPAGQGAYVRVKAEAFARKSYGSDYFSNSYWELRAAAGLAGDAAPRLDFWRLGGQSGLAGLDDGELAGRMYETGAFELGWNLAALLSRWPAPAADPGVPPGLFVVAVAEYGRVGRQSGAGASFNSDRGAFSTGLGVRFYGALPSSDNGASLTFGYAWSPQSLRTAGRIFTQVSILIH